MNCQCNVVVTKVVSEAFISGTNVNCIWLLIIAFFAKIWGSRISWEKEPTAHVTAQQAEEVAASNKGKASAVVGNILLLRCYCYLVAIAAVALYFQVVAVRTLGELMPKNINNRDQEKGCD